jgi:hypothetical protein
MNAGHGNHTKRDWVVHTGLLLLLGAAQLSWAGGTSEPLSLTISAPAVEIRESNLVLHVTMTNRSSEPITLVKSNPGCDFIAEVKDLDGRAIPLTKTGAELCRCAEQMMVGRRIRVTLNPGESTEDTYPIDLYYGLARPGRYTVQLMREVPSSGKQLTRSNELVLNLVE